MNCSGFLRALGRMILLALVVLAGVVRYGWFVRWRGQGALSARLNWMQWMSRRFLRLLRCTVEVRGKIPRGGLVVSNHLSYVDILVVGSVCPAIFVAKSEVRTWPVFGTLACMAGTVFVRRGDRRGVYGQLGSLAEALALGFPVVLFPEGTSSDGTCVLPFRSSLIEAAVVTGSAVTPVALAYELGNHDAGTDVCYWGDMTFLPHLFKLLSHKECRALLSFAGTQALSSSRKGEAVLLHRRVVVELDAIKPFTRSS